MNRIFKLISTYILLSFAVNAQSISRSQALQIAKAYGNINEKSNSLRNISDKKQDYYAFDKKDGGFVIIAGDKSMPELIGFSDKGVFPDNENMPEPLKMILDNYKEKLSDVRKNTHKVNITNTLRAFNANDYKVVGPLVKTTWNQTYPYNEKMPTYFDENTQKEQHVVVGCVPLAFATVMHYYKWPKKGKGEKTHMAGMGPNGKDLGDVKMYANFGETTYNWDKMKNSYKDEFDNDNAVVDTQEEIDAVAQLLHDVGVAGGCMFGSVGTIASWSVNAYSYYFRYYIGEVSSKTTYLYNNMNNYLEIIKRHIDEKDPLIMTGGQHAWVVDGYDSNGFLHCNWGWGGAGNGFFDYNYMDTKKGSINAYRQEGEQGRFTISSLRPNKEEFDDPEEIQKAFLVSPLGDYLNIKLHKGELVFSYNVEMTNNTSKNVNVDIGIVLEKDGIESKLYILKHDTISPCIGKDDINPHTVEGFKKGYFDGENFDKEFVFSNNIKYSSGGGFFKDRINDNLEDGSYRVFLAYKVNEGKLNIINRDISQLKFTVINGEINIPATHWDYIDLKLTSTLNVFKNLQTDRYYRYVSQFELNNGEYGGREIETKGKSSGVFLTLENDSEKYSFKIGEIRSAYNFSKFIVKYDFMFDSNVVKHGKYKGCIKVSGLMDRLFSEKYTNGNEAIFEIPGDIVITSFNKDVNPVNNVYTTDLTLSTPSKVQIEGETNNNEYMNPISRNLQIRRGDEVSASFTLLTVGDRKKVRYNGVEMTLSNGDDTYKFYTKQGILGRIATDKPTSNEIAKGMIIDVPNGTSKVSVRLFKETNGVKEFIEIQKGLYDDYTLTVCDNPDNSYKIEHPGYDPEFTRVPSVDSIKEIIDLTKKGEDKKDKEENKNKEDGKDKEDNNKTYLNDIADNSILLRISNKNIFIESNYPINRVMIYNINGVLVKNISSNNVSIDDLDKGAYIVRAYDNNNKNKTTKFVID